MQNCAIFHSKIPFPLSLTRMLESVESEGLSHIVHWTEDEKSFVICDADLFLRMVLPKFFKSSEKINILSFNRKLNRWGFKKIKIYEKNFSSYRVWHNPAFNRSSAVRSLNQVLETGEATDFFRDTNISMCALSTKSDGHEQASKELTENHTTDTESYSPASSKKSKSLTASMPKRPFSAYHLFFQMERGFIMHEISEGRKPLEDPMIKDAIVRVAESKAEDGRIKYGNDEKSAPCDPSPANQEANLKPEPSTENSSSQYFFDPNIPSRYAHLHLDKHWYSVGQKQTLEHRKTKGSCGIIELKVIVSARWKLIDMTDLHVKMYCQKLADLELDRYEKDMEEYKKLLKKADLEAMMEQDRKTMYVEEVNIVKNNQLAKAELGETAMEVNEIAVIHNNKTAVIQGIDRSDCGPKEKGLYCHFPKRSEFYIKELIETLLENFEVGSDKWIERVKAIAKLEHGPSESTIYNLFGYTKEITEAQLAKNRTKKETVKLGEVQLTEATDAQLAEALEHSRMVELVEASNAVATSYIQQKSAERAEAEARYRMQMEIQGSRLGQNMQQDRHSSGESWPGGGSMPRIPQDATAGSDSGVGGPCGSCNFALGSSVGAGDLPPPIRRQFMEQLEAGMSEGMPRGMMPGAGCDMVPPPSTTGATAQEQQIDMERERFLSRFRRKMKEKHQNNLMEKCDGGFGAGGNSGHEAMRVGGTGMAGAASGSPNI